MTPPDTASAGGTSTSITVDPEQSGVAIVGARAYDLRFAARADGPHPIAYGLQKGAPDWHNHGLWGQATLGTEWQTFTVPFAATETATDGRLGFYLGATVGTVWVELAPRDGIVLVRTGGAACVPLGSGGQGTGGASADAPAAEGGCSCRTASGPERTEIAPWALALTALALARRRRCC